MVLGLASPIEHTKYPSDHNVFSFQKYCLNIVVNFIVKHSKLLNFKRFTGTRNLIPRRPIIKDVNSHPLDIYGGI